MNDFGGRLRQARERRGVSLRQVAASTKISIAALEALERNDVSRLPGGIFTRAFVRSYATEVGLDPAETVREFLERFQGEGPASAAPAAGASPHPAPAARQPPARHVAAREDEGGFQSQQRMAGVLLKLLAISLPLAGIILYLTLWRRPGAALPTASGGGTHSGAATLAPSAGAESIEEAGRAPSPQPVAAHRPGGAPAAALAATADEPLVLELRPTGPCWISLTVDGHVVLSRLMQPGETEVRRIRDAAVVQVGDAGAFAFSINGRPGRALGEAGQVRTARISKSTVAQYLR